LFGVLDGIFGNIEALHFNTRYSLGEVIEQKSFATTNIENPVTGLEPILFGHGLGHNSPTPVVLHAAIAELAVSVPIIFSELFGNFGRFSLRKFVHPPEIIALGFLMNGRYKIDLWHKKTES